MGRRCPDWRRRRARSRGAIPPPNSPARADASSSVTVIVTVMCRRSGTGMCEWRVHRCARVQSPRGGGRSHPGSGGGGTAEPRPKRRCAVVVVLSGRRGDPGARVHRRVHPAAACVARHPVLLVLPVVVVVVPPASSRGGDPPAGFCRLFTFFGFICPRRVPVVDAEPARPGIERGSVQHARRRPGARVPAPPAAVEGRRGSTALLRGTSSNPPHRVLRIVVAPPPLDAAGSSTSRRSRPSRVILRPSPSYSGLSNAARAVDGRRRARWTPCSVAFVRRRAPGPPAGV